MTSWFGPRAGGCALPRPPPSRPERILTVASAGHLPPLLLDDSGARLVEVPTGAPLGTMFDGFQDLTIALESNTTVLLYTDGPVEERTRSIDEGLAMLRRVAGRWRRSPDALRDGVLLTMAEHRPLEDDTALLAVSLDAALTRGATCDRERFELPAEPSSATVARRQLATILRACGSEAHSEVAGLLVTEVVTNAIRHAGGERIDVTVAVDDGAVPRRSGRRGRQRPGARPRAAPRGQRRSRPDDRRGAREPLALRAPIPRR